MTHSDDLRPRLAQIRRTLRGEARSAALELLLEAAEAQDERPLVNEILEALIQTYEFSQDATRLLVPYAKFLRNYDTEPEHFDAELTRRLYWMFKWVVSKMTDHPDVPLASIEDAIAQMRRRYAEAGHSLHPVHTAEYRLHSHTGDVERADRAAAAMLATEPDSMSDCEACRCNTNGWLAAARDDYERALSDWAPILNGDLRCAHEPHATLAGSLLPLAALGRLDEARANHLHGYRISRDKDDMVRIIARHMRFCAFTGNEARAVEILEANARYFEIDFEPNVQRAFFEGVQAVCGSLQAIGLGGTQLAGPGSRTWTADELHAHADAERRAICARYDRRNGTDAVSRESRLTVAPERTYPHVPLGLKAFTPPPAPQPAAPEPAAATLEALEAALVAARAANDAFTEDVMDHWEAVDRLARALGVELEPADAANALLGRIDDSMGLEGSLELAERVQERFTAAGQPGRALANRATTLRWRLDEDAESIPALAAQVLAEAPTHAATEPVFAFRARAGALSALLLRCRAGGTEPDPELLALIEALDAELAAAPENRRNSLSRTQLALYLAGCVTEPEARLRAFRKAFDLASAGGHLQELFSGAIEYGSVLNWTGDFEAAIRVAETGLANTVPDAHPFAIAVLHLTITECATSLGLPAKAEAHAVQAAHWYDRAGERGCAGVARHLLGIALARQDRHQEAVVILEAALADLPEMHDHEHWRLADSQVLLAESYHRLNENRPALGHALEALKLLDGGLAHRNPTVYPRAAHLAAFLLEDLGEPEQAAATYRRSEQAWRELGALPTAANPARAALWADLRTGTEAKDVATGMRSLAAELRTYWQDTALPSGYREEARLELAKTLMQHANMLAGPKVGHGTSALVKGLVEEEHARVRERNEDGMGDSAEQRGLNEAAVEVLFDGEFDASLGAQAVAQLLNCLKDREARVAVAAGILGRLDPERDKAVRARIEQWLERAKDEHDR